MSWRVHRDPWDEARRLQVAGAISNLKWKQGRLEREMALSDSPRMFIGRVVTAITKAAQKEADVRWYLAINPARPLTHSIAEAARHEPECVPPERNNVFSIEAERQQREREREYRGERLARNECRAFSQELRDTAVRMHRMGVDPGPMIEGFRQDLEAKRADIRSAA